MESPALVIAPQITPVIASFRSITSQTEIIISKYLHCSIEAADTSTKMMCVSFEAPVTFLVSKLALLGGLASAGV